MITLRAGSAEMEIAAEVGGAVHAWRRGGLPMFRPAGEGDARTRASYPLVPFSNRIKDRRFSWAGRTYDLPEQFGGFAIHGVGWLRPWTVAAQEATSLTLTLAQGPCAEWPFALEAWQRFELSEDALVSVIGVRNVDSLAWPAGIGQHPFFPRNAQTRLTFAAESVFLNGGPSATPVARVPVPAEWDHRTGREVGPVFIDNCFAGWHGKAEIAYPDLGYRMTIEAGAPFGHSVVFVPADKPFFAVEPVSHINDAINRMDSEPDHGLVVLQPGASLEGRILYSVSAL